MLEDLKKEFHKDMINIKIKVFDSSLMNIGDEMAAIIAKYE